MRVDDFATGSDADSVTSYVLATPNANRASIIWLDFRTSSGGNGLNGDVYAQLLQE